MSNQSQSLYKSYITTKSSLIVLALLLVVLSTMRIVGALGAPSVRWLLPLGFVLMMLLPWVLLTRDGRRKIGLKRPNTRSSYLLGIGMGAGSAFLCFLFGYLLFGTAPDNWFVNIGNTFKASMDTSAMSFWMLTLVFTTPALLLSPIGEEIFYRGLAQDTLEQKFSVRMSTVMECSLFALVHQVHHGIIKTAAGLTYLPLSGALWFIQMFFVAWMFAWLRKRSGSIFVSILAHMMFNLTMNTTIFLFLW